MIHYLDWDSDFFEIKIGAVVIADIMEELQHIAAQAKKEQYNLVYATSDNVSIEILEKISEKSANELGPIDTKVTFIKKIAAPEVIAEHLTITAYNNADNINQLYQLAFSSGKYSRFKIDEHFTDQQFTTMYSTWVDNSVNKIIADEVFMYKLHSDINGFVTIKINDDKTATIGLIAVNEAERGMGIGQALMSTAYNYALAQGCTHIKVPTQWQNKPACLFYKKIGFEIYSLQNIYHLWL